MGMRRVHRDFPTVAGSGIGNAPTALMGAPLRPVPAPPGAALLRLVGGLPGPPATHSRLSPRGSGGRPAPGAAARDLVRDEQARAPVLLALGPEVPERAELGADVVGESRGAGVVELDEVARGVAQ